MTIFCWFSIDTELFWITGRARGGPAGAIAPHHLKICLDHSVPGQIIDFSVLSDFFSREFFVYFSPPILRRRPITFFLSVFWMKVELRHCFVRAILQCLIPVKILLMWPPQLPPHKKKKALLLLYLLYKQKCHPSVPQKMKCLIRTCALSF